MNALDLSSVVNELILGNQRAELITGHEKGYLPNGTHQHSRSIVDVKNLIDWFMELIDGETEQETKDH